MMQNAGPDNMNALTPFTSVGAVYYTAPQSMPQKPPGFQQPTQSPGYTLVQAVSTDTTDSSFLQSNHVTLEDLAAIFTMNRKGPLPEWKLTQFNGDPLDWREWFGQFRSVVVYAHLTNDVKLTYIKTLVTGQAKTASKLLNLLIVVNCILMLLKLLSVSSVNLTQLRALI